MLPWLLGFGKLGFFEEWGDISLLVSSWLGHSILVSCLQGLFGVYLERPLQWEVGFYKRGLRLLQHCKLRPAHDKNRKHEMQAMIETKQAWKAAKTDYLELLKEYSRNNKDVKTTMNLLASAQTQARIAPNPTSQSNLAVRLQDWQWALNTQTTLCTFPFVAWAVVPGRVIVVLVVCALSYGWQLQSAYLKNDVRRENRRAVHATFARLNRYEKTRP
jgi:hypothetical protein